MTSVEFLWFLPQSTDVARIGTWPAVGPEPTLDRLVRIGRAAEAAGFGGLLVPTSYHNSLEPMTTAAAVLSATSQAFLLLAVRPNQYHPAQAAKMLASLSTLFPGRLRINVTTGGWPEDRWIGNDDSREQRLGRLEEWLDVFTAILHEEEPVTFAGSFYWVDGARLPEPLPTRIRIALSGSSPRAREMLARYGDDYLLFAAPVDAVRAEIADVRATPGLPERIGIQLRAHVVVRPSETSAWAAAEDLVSKVDPRVRATIKRQRHDAPSQRGRQEAMTRAEDLVVGPNLWAGVGTARYGVAVALVGSPMQVADRLQEFVNAGVSGFILSGYPKLEECERFGELMTPVLRERGLLSRPAAGR